MRRTIFALLVAGILCPTMGCGPKVDKRGADEIKGTASDPANAMKAMQQNIKSPMSKGNKK